jgi:hypothetical protein
MSKTDQAELDAAWPKAAMPEITVPLKTVMMQWLEETARLNQRTPVEEVQRLIAEAWRLDPHRLAKGASEPYRKSPP